MKITEIIIRKAFSDENNTLKAIVSIVIDGVLAVHDIKIIDKENKFFIAMPSRKDSDGIFRDIVHPINADTREYFECEILDEYMRFLGRRRILEEINDVPDFINKD